MEAVDHSSTLILSVKQLEKGMYVSYLDRPWIETHFPFQGFAITTDEELAQLKACCEYVFIHTARGTQPDGYERHMGAQTTSDSGLRRAASQALKWNVATRTENEFREATASITTLRKAVIGVFTAAFRDEPLEIDATRDACRALRQSLERCPDAALYAIRTTDSGDYLYRHAVACAVMGMAMGQALGLPSATLTELAVGCALLDIGKTRVSQELINRPRPLSLTSGELTQVRKHVAHGIELLAKCPSSNRRLVAMVSTHHERHDGRGYPDGLEGDDIPLLGRIAGMIDLYDAMISLRNYGRRSTPGEAVRYIRQQRGTDFSPELTDQFVQIFRLYPTGALVELSDGSVGRVIQQHSEALVTPRVHVVLDPSKKSLPDYRTVELQTATDGKQALCISKCLLPGAYGIEW